MVSSKRMKFIKTIALIYISITTCSSYVQVGHQFFTEEEVKNISKVKETLKLPKKRQECVEEVAFMNRLYSHASQVPIPKHLIESKFYELSNNKQANITLDQFKLYCEYLAQKENIHNMFYDMYFRKIYDPNVQKIPFIYLYEIRVGKQDSQQVCKLLNDNPNLKTEDIKTLLKRYNASFLKLKNPVLKHYAEDQFEKLNRNSGTWQLYEGEEFDRVLFQVERTSGDPTSIQAHEMAAGRLSRELRLVKKVTLYRDSLNPSFKVCE